MLDMNTPMAQESQTEVRSLRMHAIGMIFLLTLLYLFGMFTALFVSFPQGKSDGQLWQFSMKQLPLATHIVLGILLLLGTIALIIRSFVRESNVWILSSIIAGIGVLLAIIGGMVFIPTQKDVYSFVMAVSFLISLFAYFWGIYASK